MYGFVSDFASADATARVFAASVRWAMVPASSQPFVRSVPVLDSASDSHALAPSAFTTSTLDTLPPDSSAFSYEPMRYAMYLCPVSVPPATAFSSIVASVSAMAAGALVSLRGGTNEQIGHAVAMALKNLMGLVCDPVAGLVEVPCVKRNVIGAVNAISAADMALAGIESRIPVDEVIDAMGEVGRRMPVEFRETALGGLAATPTGKAVKERMPHGAQ